jgi:hypothetical protein
MPTSTPWGTAQDSEKICRGINFYSTASHGGYKISDKLNKEIPEVFRNNDGWYEEDCEWSIPRVFLSEYWGSLWNDNQLDEKKGKEYISAHDTLTRWYPHKWQEFNGVEISKSSHCWDCQKNTCHATKNMYPKSLKNTGYGKYRVTLQQTDKDTFEVVMTKLDKQVTVMRFKDLPMADNCHSNLFDSIYIVNGKMNDEAFDHEYQQWAKSA